PLPYAQAYYDLGIKSGDVKGITATFYYDTGDPAPADQTPLKWYDGTAWQTCTSQSITRTNLTVDGTTFDGAVTIALTDTSAMVGQVTPTLSAVNAMNHIAQTSFFALSYSSTTSSASSTTTTASAGGGGGGGGPITTTSSSSSSSSTTTSINVPSTPITTTPLPIGLSVTPAFLEFSDNETAKQLSIANTGSGNLNWSIADNNTEYNDGDEWIFSVNPKAGSVAGVSENVTVTVNRRLVSSGTYTALLPVTSNAGNLDVDVSMEVTQPGLPIMGVTPRVVMFLNDDNSTQSLNIRNLLTGALTWEIMDPIYHTGNNWLTAKPTSGYTERGRNTITLAVDRQGMQPGLYSATLPVRSNSGIKNVTVMLRIQQDPQMGISSTFLFFMNQAETEKTFSVSNTGTDTATWNIGEILYRGPGAWITSIQPDAGAITAEEEQAVTISVNRGELGAGIYSATIPIQSEDGTSKNVLVLLFVPLM
ncbi:MAG: hypothetical protein GY850_14560, partial [bacterium]|nr:hypothetical protein [bacterium]